MVASAVVATGATALQVLPSTDAGATGQHPARPYFATTESVVRGNNTIRVHGSCFQPDRGTQPLGTPTSDGGWVWAATNLANPNFRGEYPYGGVNDALHNNGNVPYGVVSNVQASWANDVVQSRLALEYVTGIPKYVLAPMSAGMVDEQGRATYYREAATGALTTTITGGHVEYLVYSDSYSTGPIDLDATPVNKDGSYDIRLNTLGLGPDTYTVRFLGCRELAGTYEIDILSLWSANYYQGSPHIGLNGSPSDIFTNDDATVNDPAAASYVPTTGASTTPTGGIEQTRLGTDNFRCQYDSDGSLPGAGQNSITLTATAQSAGRGPNEASNVVTFGPTDQFTCPEVVIPALPTEVLPLTSGYNGNTDFSCLNRYNNTQNYAGGEYGITTPYPLGPVGGGTPNGQLPLCPSGYDPVGIRANSIFDYYGRFQVTAPAAASPSAAPTPAAAPAFVAPTNTQAAAAAQQATINVISSAGGSPVVQPVVTSTPTQPAGTPSAALAVPTANPTTQTGTAQTGTAQPTAAATSTGAATPTAAATPAGVSVKTQTGAVQARVLAPAKSVTNKVTAKPKAKVVTKVATVKSATAAKKTTAKTTVKKAAAKKTTAKTTVKKAAAKTTVKKATVKK